MTNEILQPKILDPMVIITIGVPGTGKTAAMKEFGRLVPNAVFIQKDTLNEAFLLGPFTWLQDPKSVLTPFGEMQMYDRNSDYYGRHVRFQSYSAMLAQARDNLDLGKVAIIDPISIQMIRDGTIRKIIVHFEDKYPVILIHFVANAETCFRRLIDRARKDHYSRLRDDRRIASWQAFCRSVTEEPIDPPEINLYPHLIVDTTNRTPLQCARFCLERITSQ